jgi:hypothetical protein
MNAQSLQRIGLATWVLCGVFGAIVYVAAKIDFVRRFDPNNLAGYLAGHWPYFAALAILAAIAWLGARFRTGEGSSGG